MPILMSVSSGHGNGKAVLGAWIANWIMSTRPHSIGTVTANTFRQLESRTWAALLDGVMYDGTLVRYPESGIYRRRAPKTGKWSCRRAAKRMHDPSLASTRKIRRRGICLMKRRKSRMSSGRRMGLTDGEPMFFASGQPSRSNGKFHEITFGSQRNRWNHRTIDSRTSRFTNRELIEHWRVDNGEDSDFFRVRVLGVPPRASDL